MLTQQYIAAFSRCYPQKRVDVKARSRNGQMFFRVAINGDDGGRELTEADMRSAIRDFGRGKVVH